MTFNEQLAKRVRKQLAGSSATEKKMFGGLAFLLNGHMSVGVHGDELIVRVAPESTDQRLTEPGARQFDITGRPMKGWLLISETGIKDAASLKKWVGRGIQYASSLPKKA